MLRASGFFRPTFVFAGFRPVPTAPFRTPMKSQQDILSTLRELFEELFEIEPEKVTPEARLYEDLDIDSIDAVDLVVRLKEITGKAVEPEQFKSVRTVQDIVDAVDEMISA
ncbi:acyl carrier protein [uncultured Abyssibacter sp.]|uniref:acyl carrier protein n=1 Tax=uncultured Abyssibacter sp. TaxID=2320202 RepID=UPI0032B22BF1|tara:strand:- start:334 stop:666 length:333 start_codon:yes stop_codon:yes gene_type:complete